MATWQYSIKLLPRRGIVKYFSNEPDKVDHSEVEEADLWKNETISDSFREELNKILPSTKSWSNEIEQFGSLEETCIEIMYESKEIYEVSIRLDLRNLTKEIIEFLLSCEQNFGLIMYDYENGAKIDSLTRFGDLIKSSSAYSFLKDPIRFIENLKGQ